MEKSKYFLNNYEKETIILWNEAEPTAEVYTCSASMMRHMDELVEKCTEITRTEETEYSKTYVLPKKLVKVRAPLRLSDERRRELSRRAQAMAAKRSEAKE